MPLNLICRLWRRCIPSGDRWGDPFGRVKRLSLEQCLRYTKGLIGDPEARLLYDLARETRQGCIVEIGSYRGRSAVALGRGSLDGHGVAVYAIEPHAAFRGVLGGEFGPPDRGAFFQAMLDTSCYHVVRLVNLSSEEVTPGWTRQVSLLFIDGDHSYEGVARDFKCWAPFLAPSARLAFDDATDPEIGPWKLIQELVASGGYEEIAAVGRVRVIAARRRDENHA